MTVLEIYESIVGKLPKCGFCGAVATYHMRVTYYEHPTTDYSTATEELHVCDEHGDLPGVLEADPYVKQFVRTQLNYAPELRQLKEATSK